MWRQHFVRDVLAPLAGVFIELHQSIWAAEPRYLIVVAGLMMIGIPIDAAATLLGKQANVLVEAARNNRKPASE